MDIEPIMKRWDLWRKYIAEGGTASWPRDEFEMVIELFNEDTEKLEQIKKILER